MSLKCASNVKKLTAKACEQRMSPLPFERLAVNDQPFSSVGVDYFEPFHVKRGSVLEKRYGCLFTCLKIRAVHLEISHSLSTESFLMAFSRFCSRRGIPKVFSNNGSNFVGAEVEIRTHINGCSTKKINDKMLEYNIEWFFNPPECSHRRGLWERMIRSTRRTFRAISNDVVMDNETLHTVMIEAERIVNNRPLCALSDRHHDLDVLTPNKILLLESNDVHVDPEPNNNQYLRRWRRVCHLSQTFRKRWVREYLSASHNRQKWHKICRNLKVGDLVMVMSENIGLVNWPMGIVT